jgi:hypothetical protein
MSLIGCGREALDGGPTLSLVWMAVVTISTHP